jgi:hypothetical protein
LTLETDKSKHAAEEGENDVDRFAWLGIILVCGGDDPGRTGPPCRPHSHTQINLSEPIGTSLLMSDHPYIQVRIASLLRVLQSNPSIGTRRKYRQMEGNKGGEDCTQARAHRLGRLVITMRKNIGPLAIVAMSPCSNHPERYYVAKYRTIVVHQETKKNRNVVP